MSEGGAKLPFPSLFLRKRTLANRCLPGGPLVLWGSQSICAFGCLAANHHQLLIHKLFNPKIGKLAAEPGALNAAKRQLRRGIG